MWSITIISKLFESFSVYAFGMTVLYTAQTTVPDPATGQPNFRSTLERRGTNRIAVRGSGFATTVT